MRQIYARLPQAIRHGPRFSKLILPAFPETEEFDSKYVVLSKFRCCQDKQHALGHSKRLAWGGPARRYG